MSKPDTDQPVGAEQYQCAGLEGCRVLEAALSEMFVHDRNCPAFNRPVGYKPSPTKAARCVKCGHNKLRCTETVWADDIRAEPAPCGCACVFPAPEVDEEATAKAVAGGCDVLLLKTPAPEPSEPLTVESCLKELREMFDDRWFAIEVSYHLQRLWYWIRVYGKPRQGQGIESLEEAMAQVRAWKESQQQ